MTEAAACTEAMTDPRQLLLDAPMSGFQTRAIVTMVALCALDGFDVFAITFAAPALLKEWGLGKAELGVALSAGLLGMALGSLLLAPLADSFGRRRMLFVALGIMVLGTAWTALVDGLGGLIASRLFTGLGIGAMIGVTMPLAAKYANSRRREVAVAGFNVGFPLGGIIGGSLRPTSSQSSVGSPSSSPQVGWASSWLSSPRECCSIPSALLSPAPARMGSPASIPSSHAAATALSELFQRRQKIAPSPSGACLGGEGPE